MKRYFTLFAAAALASTAAMAQDPISGGSKMLFGMIKGNLVKAAEKMPEENYSFQPTKDVRTFAQLIGHVADANIMFCSAAKGETKPTAVEKGAATAGKAALVASLKDAIAYCDGVYNAMTDKDGAATAKFFGRDMGKLTILNFNVAHDNEHYGNIVTYMRLKGLVPPSSENSR
jgi:uncharacterized damage-inducible protein DinB